MSETGATPPEPEEFLSGETGHVAGIRRTVSRTVGDALLDVRARTHARSLDRLAAAVPRRGVLGVSVYRPGSAHIEPAVRELRRTRHDLRLRLGSTGEPLPGLADSTAAGALSGGKFQNLNRLLQGAAEYDWLLVFDDDVGLPPHFLDRLLGLAEHFDLALVQPAQTLMSHAAWRVARRRGGSLLRETRFVEIGPVTAFRRDAAETLTPFPDLRYGWGLDLHWAALAAERGWRLGIADALPVRHEHAPVATAYGFAEPIAEAQRFLTGRPFVRASQAQETLATHRKVTP
ncbi:MAG TPA: glycosyltransferase [Thermoleophilaceae bacterium]